MARPRVVLHGAGVRALLNDPGVVSELESRMAPVLTAARAIAPVKSGDYVASLGMETVKHKTRTVVRVQTDSDYGLDVEGRLGVLSRAFDAVGG